MTASPIARDDTLVIGIGNSLRQDDGVGIEMIGRLERYFSGKINALFTYEPDLCLAEKISLFKRMIIIDAAFSDKEKPFDIITIEPAKAILHPGGVAAHLFDWPMLLAVARDIYGRAPEETIVVAISARNFAIDDRISDECAVNAEEAFQYLICDLTV